MSIAEAISINETADPILPPDPNLENPAKAAMRPTIAAENSSIVDTTLSEGILDSTHMLAAIMPIAMAIFVKVETLRFCCHVWRESPTSSRKSEIPENGLKSFKSPRSSKTSLIHFPIRTRRPALAPVFIFSKILPQSMSEIRFSIVSVKPDSLILVDKLVKKSNILDPDFSRGLNKPCIVSNKDLKVS